MVEKGHCKHGEFDLSEGCAQCIAERMAREGNTPESIAEEIEAVQPKAEPAVDEMRHQPKQTTLDMKQVQKQWGSGAAEIERRRKIGIRPEQDEMEDGLNAEGYTLARTNLNIVKVQYEHDEGFGSREYSYYSIDRLNVGDIVLIPVRDTTGRAKVSTIDVPESEVANFKDKLKTISADSVLPPEEEKTEEAEALGEEITIAEGEVAEITGDGSGKALPEVGTAVIMVDPGKAPSFAKHLESAKRIVEIAASREILNEADAKAANDDLNVMAELRKAVEAERKSFTVPLNDHLSAINGAYKLITGPLQEADQITRQLLTAYKVEQQRKVAEAEKLNQDAIDLARRQAEANNGEFTVEITPVPVPFAPKLTRTDQGKSGLVDNWKFRIVDLEKLPREYMVPDEAMLNFIAKNQHDKKQVPGVEFYNSPSLRVTR